MRRATSVAALTLLLCAAAHGQALEATSDATRPAAPSIPPSFLADAYAPLPVTIWLKDGRRMKASLIRNGGDSFLVEAGGVRMSIAVEEVEGILFQARMLDSFGKLASNDTKARLDNYMIELQQHPTTRGYVFCYAGRRAERGEAAARCDFLRDYMTGARGMDPQRLVMVDGGFRQEHEVELWIVPFGSQPPAPSPTLNPSQVTIITAPGRNNRTKKKTGTSKGKKKSVKSMKKSV